MSVPMLPFDRPPVGVGDLTSGVMLAKRLRGASWVESLEHTAAAYYAVMQATSELNEYELQTVAAQAEIAQPATTFQATKLR